MLTLHEDNLRAILVAAIQTGSDTPTATIKAVLACLAEKDGPAAQTTSSPLQAPALKPGEEYAGLIATPDGKSTYHLILLPGDNDDGSWEAQMDWAKSIGGDLPDRVEQAMLFKHLPHLFQKAAYWSNTRHTDSTFAWYQYFVNGGQNSHHETSYLRGRAVRRLFI